MKYKKLKGICKVAIETGMCLGCAGLAENDWIEPEQCPYMFKKVNSKRKEYNQLSIKQL